MLDNLVENALNYSPPGTTVTIEFGGDAALGDGSAVRDEGPGIEADERERVFERFYRGSGSRATDGTGLGLAVVEALAQRWGGEASLANREAAERAPRCACQRRACRAPDLELDRALPGAG